MTIKNLSSQEIDYLTKSNNKTDQSVSKSNRKNFGAKKIENELAGDFSNLVKSYTSKANISKTLEVKDLVFKEYRVDSGKKTLDEKFQLIPLIETRVGLFPANEKDFDANSVWLDEKDFDEQTKKLYEKYGFESFSLWIGKNKQANEFDFSDSKFEKPDTKKQATDVNNSIEAFNKFLSENNIDTFDQKLDINKINIVELKFLQDSLVKFCANLIGLKNTTILTSALREKVQAYSTGLQLKINDLINKISQTSIKNSSQQLFPDIGEGLDFGNAQKNSQKIYQPGEIGKELEKIFKSGNEIKDQNPELKVDITFEDENLQAKNNQQIIYDWFENLVSQIFSYQKNGYTIVRSIGTELNPIISDEKKIFILPVFGIQENKKKFFELKKLTQNGKNIKDIKGFEIIENIWDFPQHNVSEKSKKSILRKKVYKILDNHYVERNSNFLESILARSLNFGIHTKRGVEDMIYSIAYKDEYKRRNKQIQRESKKQSKEFDKSIRQKIISDSIWQNKKTGASPEIIKDGKRLLATWRKKTLFFSKNKYHHTDKLVNFLRKNNLTYKDIGMTPAEKMILTKQYF